MVGPLTEGGIAYFRITGPTLLIEYSPQTNDGNHVYSIYRDPTNEYGAGMDGAGMITVLWLLWIVLWLLPLRAIAHPEHELVQNAYLTLAPAELRLELDLRRASTSARSCWPSSTRTSMVRSRRERRGASPGVY